MHVGIYAARQHEPPARIDFLRGVHFAADLGNAPASDAEINFAVDQRAAADDQVKLRHTSILSRRVLGMRRSTYFPQFIAASEAAALAFESLVRAEVVERISTGLRVRSGRSQVEVMALAGDLFLVGLFAGGRA